MTIWSRGLRVAIIGLVGLLLVWGGVALTGMANGNDRPGDDVTLSDATKKELTVSPEDLLPSDAKCTSGDRFNRNSISGKGKWSDSVSTPNVSSDKDGMLAVIFNENCTNPVLLDMNVQALSKVTIDGWNVGDHNPWMGEFLAKASEPGLREAFLTKKENVDGVFVTADFQRAAAMTNTLLSRFKNVGVVTQPSVTNWHLPGGGLQAGELVRTVLNDKQENLPVLRLELTEKGQGCMYAIGFNTGDKRFETLKCEQPTPTTPTTPGQPTPECVKDCGTPPPPGCVKDCSPPPTCPPDMPHGTWPVCKDDPSNQPDGDHPDGNHPGGHNDTDGPGDPNPEPTFPSTPHTNPSTPTPSSIPDDSTPAPTNQPTPDPEPSSNPSDGSGNDGDPGGF